MRLKRLCRRDVLKEAAGAPAASGRTCCLFKHLKEAAEPLRGRGSRLFKVRQEHLKEAAEPWGGLLKVRQEHLQAAAGAPAASGRTCSPPVVPSTCVLYFCFFSFSIVSHLQLGGRPDERCPRRLCAYINAAVCMTYACMYVYMPADRRSSEGTMSSSLCVLFFLIFIVNFFSYF